jgi:hypothetical protein
MPSSLRQLWRYCWAIKHFFRRLPDEPELAHRHVLSLSAVRDNGPEMEDAAEYYLPPTPTPSAAAASVGGGAETGAAGVAGVKIDDTRVKSKQKS